MSQYSVVEAAFASAHQGKTGNDLSSNVHHPPEDAV